MDFRLKTDRLYLRPPESNDVDELFELMSNEKLTKFLTWEPHKEIGTTQSLISALKESQANDKAYHWCVVLNSKIIGLVSLIDVRRRIRTWIIDRAELSYWISPEHQGKGYATEASKSVIDFGFQQLELHKIIIAHAAHNIESKRICEKLGFKQYAFEHDAFMKDGVWNDLLWYEIINER